MACKIRRLVVAWSSAAVSVYSVVVGNLLSLVWLFSPSAARLNWHLIMMASAMPEPLGVLGFVAGLIALPLFRVAAAWIGRIEIDLADSAGLTLGERGNG